MDFVTHFPQTPRRHDAVWVIVDRLTKLAHFLAVRMTFTLEEFFRLYIREIVRLHGVSVCIVSNRDPRFTTHFWKSFQKAMGKQLTIQILSVDRWSVEEYHTNFRGHAASMRLGSKGYLGGALILSGILLQQHLSGEYTDGTL